MCSRLGVSGFEPDDPSLSGGESQRLKMVRHLGSSLTGIVYIIDEPSTGLHPADIVKLNILIGKLRDKGNTILMVEHDPDMIAIAEHVIDLGPGRASKGGNIVFEVTCRHKQSQTLTGRYFSSRAEINKRPRCAKGYISVRNATLHNLHNLSVDVPLSVMVAVTGVAGSGKSSFVMGPWRHNVGTRSLSIKNRYILRFDRILLPGAAHLIRSVRCLPKNHVSASWFSANAKGACPECHGLG